jgi:hypothetical protein
MYKGMKEGKEGRKLEILSKSFHNGVQVAFPRGKGKGKVIHVRGHGGP